MRKLYYGFIAALLVFGGAAWAEEHLELGWQVLIDDDEAGAMLERIEFGEDHVRFEQELRFLFTTDGSSSVQLSLEQSTETASGELIEISLQQGSGNDLSTLTGRLKDDVLSVEVSASWGSFERDYPVEQALIGPVKERHRIHEQLLKVGDSIVYRQLDPAMGRPARITAELVEINENGHRIVTRTLRDRPGETRLHFDQDGNLLRTENEFAGGSIMVMNAIDPAHAAELIAAIEIPDESAEPSILDTDTEFVDGSGINIDSLDDQTQQRLVLLGQVWGFLKYHHPAITSGSKHWDFELFRMLPDYLAADDASAFLNEWIDSLGELEPCDPCASLPEQVHVEPDLDWLNDEQRLRTALSVTLQTILQQRPANHGQFFVNLAGEAGFASFQRELAYEDIGLDDIGYRLLTLYRWWNIIEYWFPYRYMIDGNWHGVLVEFLPRILLAESTDDYRRELLAFAAHIGDGHVFLQPSGDVLPPVGECRWPVAIRFIEDQPVVVALGDEIETALEVGDVVQSIDGEELAELLAAWAPYYSASNEPSRRYLQSFFLSRGECGAGEVTVERAGSTQSLVVERKQTRGVPYAHDLPGDAARMLSEPVGYLSLSSFDSGRIDDYLEILADARALVIDIRNYPADFAVFALGQHLVNQTTEFARFTAGRMAAPGAFAFGATVSLEPRPPFLDMPIAILVDEGSMSQAEYTAMAFRFAPDAVVIGSTTAGANGNVASFALPGGMSSSISGIGAYYADSSPMQRIGIIADIPASPSIDGFRQGRDEVLEVALRHLLGNELTDNEIQGLARR